MAKKLQASDEFLELMRKGSMCIALANNTQITLDGTYGNTKVPLDSNVYNYSKRNVFSLYDNGIKVSKAGRYLVSGNIMMTASNSSMTVIGTIRRKRASNSAYSRLSSGYMRLSASNGWLSLGLTPYPIYLEAGDIIYLCVGGSSAETVNVGGASAYTYLTITEL